MDMTLTLDTQEWDLLQEALEYYLQSNDKELYADGREDMGHKLHAKIKR